MAQSNIIVRIGSRGFNALSKFGRVLKPRVKKFSAAASVEMAPPSRVEFMEAVSNLKNINLGKVPDMSVNEIAARGLVLAEIALWFYVGEMIGRGSIIGYNPKV